MTNDTLQLSCLPSHDDLHSLQQWAERLAHLLAADIREFELAADQYCWRLSIAEQHWLLFYSALCQSVWLQALESAAVLTPVAERLGQLGWLTEPD